MPLIPGGRLTVSPGKPIITADQISKTALFYSPFDHDQIEILDSTGAWQSVPFLSGPTDEVGISLSLAAAAYTANSMHDVFALNASGACVLATAPMPLPSQGGGGLVRLPACSTIVTGTGGNPWVNANSAFDTNQSQDTANSARNSPSNSGIANYIGQDWGLGQAYRIGQFFLRAPSDDYLRGDATSTLPVVLDGSQDGTTWQRLGSWSVDASGITGKLITISTGIDTTTEFRMHRVGFGGNGINGIKIAEIGFDAITQPTVSTRGIVRYAGRRVNASTILCQINATTQATVAPYQARYLGSILIDQNAGHLTCHAPTSYGLNRRFGVWNNDNQRTIKLKAGGSAKAPNAVYPNAWGPLHSDPNNNMTFITGMDDEAVEARYYQAVNSYCPSGASAWGVTAIGINSTTVPSGTWGQFGQDASGSAAPGSTDVAVAICPPVAGKQVLTALASSMQLSGGIMTFFSGELNSMLTASWQG